MRQTWSFKKPVYFWLAVGLAMVFVQVVVGGITRLTDSGLSITDWALIQGVMPPTSNEAWNEAFSLYKEHASKQYLSLHADMTMSEFKWIYFWEYIHRLWARIMGFVFFFPLLFFIVRGWIDRNLGYRLGAIFGLAAAAGVFGWVMVASGLNEDNRTWVSAYKLITHLGIAISLFTLIYWTMCYYKKRLHVDIKTIWDRNRRIWIALLFVQILLGGLMAGMRAGLVFPFYPLAVKAELVQAALGAGVEMTDLDNYEAAVGVKAWVQVLHRLMALVVVAFLVYIWNKNRSNKPLLWLLIAVIVQYGLGVATVVKSIGGIPVSWGAIHQAAALIIIVLSVRWIWSRAEPQRI